MSRRSAPEYCGFLEWLWRLGDLPCEVIDLADMPVGSYPRAFTLGLLSPEEIAANALWDRAETLDAIVRSHCHSLWRRLRVENAPLRVVAADGLRSAPITFFDQQLLSFAKASWQKPARIIGEILSDQAHPSGRASRAQRVRLEREHAIAHQRISTLMQELTHRVKNSLQSIAALVFIEARSHKSGEGKAALERVSHRIDALGLLYSKLSKSDTVEAVDAATYLDDLCRELVASVQGATAIALKTDIDNELLPTDKAIPIGLVVNELVTNALKYAFPNETKGTVTVTLKRAPGELRLTVADDGKGIDIRRADSGLGGRLVEGFAQQLGGQVERESGNQGTTVRLILPLRDDSGSTRVK
jgi:two-component sensor histidine kinase